MKKLACADLNPTTTCNFAATGESSQEVASKMMSHAKENHMDDLKKTHISDSDIKKMMTAKAHD